MKRSSRGDSDRKLLDAARAMLQETGLSDLKLRAVARRAGVNLGMFHYHFGSKAEFKRRLFQEVYEEFFSRLTLESRTEGSHIERLRRVLVTFGRFARDNRRLFVMLLSETLRGDKICAQYLQANVPRHVAVVSGLIAQGQRVGEIKSIPLPIALAFAMGGMGLPNLIAGAMERFGAKLSFVPFGKDSEIDAGTFLSDRAIELRAELILDGLSKRRKR